MNYGNIYNITALLLHKADSKKRERLNELKFHHSISFQLASLIPASEDVLKEAQLPSKILRLRRRRQVRKTIASEPEDKEDTLALN